MVASSPVRHESPMQANPVEVQSYQPPWKALSEFAMQSELEHPPFQQLVSSFVCDVSHDDDDDDHVVCYDQCWLVRKIITWFDPSTHGKSHLKYHFTWSCSVLSFAFIFAPNIYLAFCLILANAYFFLLLKCMEFYSFFFKLTLNYFRPISISISIASVHLMFISACQISATEGVKGPKKKDPSGFQCWSSLCDFTFELIVFIFKTNVRSNDIFFIIQQSTCRYHIFQFFATNNQNRFWPEW